MASFQYYLRVCRGEECSVNGPYSTVSDAREQVQIKKIDICDEHDCMKLYEIAIAGQEVMTTQLILGVGGVKTCSDKFDTVSSDRVKTCDAKFDTVSSDRVKTCSDKFDTVSSDRVKTCDAKFDTVSSDRVKTCDAKFDGKVDIRK